MWNLERWGSSSLRCLGSSLWWLLLWTAASRLMDLSSCSNAALVVVVPRLYSTGSVVVASWLSCSEACRIFLDQGSNPCPLHWQVNSYPLHHREVQKRLLFFLSNFIEIKDFFEEKIVGINEKKKSVQRRPFQAEGAAKTRV